MAIRLRTLDIAKPVKDEVADAFLAGLRARVLLATQGRAPFRLALVIRKFDADMLMDRTARIDLTTTAVDQHGHSVYRDSAVDKESDFKFLETGMLANITDLQTLSEIVLDRTVDRLLDALGFRTAFTQREVANVPVQP